MSRSNPVRATLKPRLHAVAAAAATVMAVSASTAADFGWSGGEFIANVSVPGVLGAGDRLFINAGSTKQFSLGDVLNNNGTVVWNADFLYGANGAVVNNAGLWDSRSDTTGLVWNAGAQPIFNNTGEFRKSAGVQTNVGNWRFVNNAGTLNAQTGILNFNGGYNEFNAGTRFIGAGVNQIGSNSTFTGAFRSDNLRLFSGTVTGAGARLTGGVATTGQVDFAGGDLRGTWEVAAGTALNGVSGLTKQLNVGLNLVNNGAVQWKTTEALYFANGATLTNNALFDAQAAGTMVWNAGALPSFVNSAAGTLRAANNITFNVGDVQLVNNGGRLQAASGANLVFNGGRALFNDNTRFIGTGRNLVNSAARFVGRYTSENLELAGGTLTGGDGATAGSRAIAQGTTRWTGGDLRGAWEVAAGHTWLGLTGLTKQLNAGLTMVNNGSILWSTTDALYGANGAVLTNNALFEAQAAGTMIWNAGAAPAFVNQAGGTLRAAAGVTFNVGNIGLVNNGGALDAAAGATLVYNGGNTVFNAGTRFTGAGSNLVNANASFNGALQSANLRIAGGIQTGNAAALNGTTTWSGGDLRGTWQVAAGQTLLGVAGLTKQLNIGLALNNTGTFLWQTTDALYGANGAVLTNNGLFEAQANGSMVWNAGAAPSFVNTSRGTLRAADGVTFNVGNIGLVNNGGTLDAGAGAVLVYGGGNTQFNNFTRFTGAGINRVTAAATFDRTYNATNLELAGGVLTGVNAVARGTTVLRGGDLRGTWTIAGGQTWLGQSGTTKQLNVGLSLTNNGALVWQTDEALYMANGATLVNNGTMEFQAGGDVVWNAGSAPALVNNGLLLKTAGAETSLAGPTLTNAGVIEARAGSIRLPEGFVNTGTLRGGGTFAASVVSNSGLLAPGNTVGALNINGSFAQGAGGVLDIDLRTTTRRDRLLISGNAALGGTLALKCRQVACTGLGVGTEILILDAVGEMTGTFANVTLSGFTGAFDVIYDTAADQVRLRVSSLDALGLAGGSPALAAAAVPEPGTYALMLAGLGAVGWLTRRRRSARR